MEQVELLYINFLNHPFLKGLELNFSHEIAFKLTDEKQLLIEKLESKRMFNNAITNLNIIVGKNGVGKTTILNEVYHLLHGTIEKNKIVAIRKNKNVYIYIDNNEVSININNFRNVFGEFYFVIKKEGFYLENHNSLKSKIELDIKNLIYISEFTDLSIDSSIHKYEKNYAFNYSPMVLINSPDYFLDSINHQRNNKLQQTISNFRLISKIHQIEFLANKKFKFDFKIPEYIQFNFNSFFSRIETRFKSKINEKRYEQLDHLLSNLLQRGNKNSIRYIFDVHLTLSMYYLLDIKRYLFDKEKARKQLHLYKDSNSSSIEKEWRKCLKYYNEGVKSILTEFSLGNITVFDFYLKYISLIEKTKITIFYSSEDSDEIDLEDKVKELITSYGNLISILNANNCEIYRSLKLPLLEAAIFLRNYLILRNYTGTFNEICIPDDIIYLSGEKNFYFSSGEEQLLRLFTYIDLSVDYIENHSEENQNSFIILMDEPDNALHPEMQKEFIKNLNSFLNQYNRSTFHLILTSHSPIITSDLTKNHVLFLKKDQESHSVRSIDNNKKPDTFAQNIYNLYKESFYIEDGLIGSYAEGILSGIYSQLSGRKMAYNNEIYNKQDNYIYSKEEISFYIREIGEPILKRKFEDIFYPNNKKGLLREILEKHDLPSDLREDLISLILKNEEN